MKLSDLVGQRPHGAALGEARVELDGHNEGALRGHEDNGNRKRGEKPEAGT